MNGKKRDQIQMDIKDLLNQLIQVQTETNNKLESIKINTQK